MFIRSKCVTSRPTIYFRRRDDRPHALKQAFTLIEPRVVIAIIAILAAMLLTIALSPADLYFLAKSYATQRNPWSIAALNPTPP